MIKITTNHQLPVKAALSAATAPSNVAIINGDVVAVNVRERFVTLHLTKAGFNVSRVSHDDITATTVLKVTKMKLSKHETVLIYYLRMRKLYESIEDDGDSVWDEFWTLATKLNDHVHIEYYDPDTSYKEDMQAKLTAISQYLRNNKITLG